MKKIINKQRIRRRLSGLIVLLAVFQLSAQNENSPSASGGVSENQAVQNRKYLLSVLTQSNDRDEKILAVQQFRRMAQNGSIKQGDESLFRLLNDLLSHGVSNKRYDKQFNLLNSNVLIRMEICRLLGDIGGTSAKEILLKAIQRDSDPTLLAIAVESLRKADPDGDARTVTILADTFTRHHYVRKDNTLANSFLTTISEYVINTNGELLIPAVSDALHLISLDGSSYMSAVRTRGRSMLLDWLKTY